MSDRRSQYEKHGGMNLNIKEHMKYLEDYALRYGHRRIRWDKYQKKLPIGKALLERES